VARTVTQEESTAHRALVTTLVVLGVIVLALALWKLKLVVALLFVAITIAAAMRPGVERMARRGIPRAGGVLLHYLVLLGLIALFLSFVVPHLVTQVQEAIDTANSQQAHRGDGVRDRVLAALDARLRDLPSARELYSSGLRVGQTAVEVLVGVFFVFASAAYWIFERDRAIEFVASLVERRRPRQKVRDTWELIDLKLGAYVRGQLVIVALVGTVMSIAFAIIGEPYWLLIGIAVALFEIVPVVGPLVAFVLAVGVGVTDSWQTAVLAGSILLVVRLAQDYFVNPHVLGGAVGLSPLVVLVSVAATGILLGGFYVLLSVPLASLIATVFDVVVRGAEPTEQEVPSVLFTPKDVETTRS
jgi:predicted PurR-regulated permease PerM